MEVEGKYKVGNEQYLYLNSKTGEGFKELIKLFSRFMKFQNSTMEFPSFSKEDLDQHMLMLAYEAIPRYDATKNANLMTFLQNHVKNRLINMCKYYSEKKRSSTHTTTTVKKIRCNGCRQFFRADTNFDITCPFCSKSAAADSDQWKKYNMLAVPGSFFSTDPEGNDKSNDQIEVNPDLISFAIMSIPSEETELDIEIRNFMEKQTDEKKSIIALLSQGYTNLEIASRLNITVPEIKSILKQISADFRKEDKS